ncbi:MAG: hypothetical protein ACD_9C00254G0018 [uncultured bacterium]|nr:MAG: hypothetical protein ACD_9C00254G0018 [uncultured bacterium]
MTKDNLDYAVGNARSAEQAEEMRKAAEKETCIFCQINFEKNKPLNKKGEFDPEGKGWPLLWVWENPFPQEHQFHHIVIIPRRHIRNEEFFLLTEEEWIQILDAWKWACQFYNILGGGFLVRFGERKYNAGTVGHLHFQIQAPDGTGNVKATLFKDKSPAEEARRANRAAYHQNKVTGYIYMNSNGLFLGKNLRWEKCIGVHHAFVHAESANKHIWTALMEWHEDNHVLSVWYATWIKDEEIKLTREGGLDPALIRS